LRPSHPQKAAATGRHTRRRARLRHHRPAAAGLLALALTLTVAGLAAVSRGLPQATAAAGSSTLGPGETLGPDQALRSPNGAYELVMQDDGHLVLRGPGAQVLFASGTHGNPGTRLQNQNDDGNIVLLAPGGRPSWATNTGTGQQPAGDGGEAVPAGPDHPDSTPRGDPPRPSVQRPSGGSS
jgi:hypothetical protein